MALLRVKTSFTGAQVAGGGINHMYFADGAAEAATVHAAVAAFWNSVRGVIHSSTTIRVEGEVDQVDEASGELTGISTVTAVSYTGGDSAEPLPPATQLLARLRTGQRVAGREVRGRFFIPALTQSMNDNGVPASVYLADVNTALATLANHSTADWAVYSRTYHVAYSITSATAWTKFATLRSRRD